MKLRRRYIFSVLFFMLVIIHSYGQNANNYKNQFKLSPVKIADLINPGIEFNYERKFGNFSTQLSAAYLVDVFGITVFSNFKGFRVGVEEKYFLNSQRKIFFRKREYFHPYLSASLAFAKVDYKFESKFGIIDPDTDFVTYEYLDAFGIKKQTMALNFKYGFQTIYKHWIVDISFGLGLKYKNVEHYDRNNPTDQLIESRHANVYDISNKEMKGITLNVPATLKIGYVF